MAKFKLLAGKHVEPDHKAKPIPMISGITGSQMVDPVTKELIWKYPSRVYKAGETIETDLDLVKRFGANKFLLVSGTPNDPGPAGRRKATAPAEAANILHSNNPAVAPGGQVSSGFQQTTGVDPETDPDGRTQVTGPLDVEDPKVAKSSGADLGGDEGGSGPKFTREDLNDLSVHELRQVAADDEIDLGDSTKKADIINKILGAK